MCEDAPCCGCCGPAVWAADARSDEEWRDDPQRWEELDRMYDEEYAEDWDGEEDEDEE